MIHREERKEDKKVVVSWITCDSCGARTPEQTIEVRYEYMRSVERPQTWGVYVHNVPPEGQIAKIQDLCPACTKRVDVFIKALRSTR